MKNEWNFNKMIIQPLWVVFNKAMSGTVSECQKNVESNVDSWEALLNEINEEIKKENESKLKETIIEVDDDELEEKGESEKIGESEEEGDGEEEGEGEAEKDDKGNSEKN